tara:strand:+ start:258 stop:1058 length:801 start_codon:yes stop_codon:yes gene_type:complete
MPLTRLLAHSLDQAAQPRGALSLDANSTVPDAPFSARRFVYTTCPGCPQKTHWSFAEVRDTSVRRVPDAAACQLLCDAQHSCEAWLMNGCRNCVLYSGISGTISSTCLEDKFGEDYGALKLSGPWSGDDHTPSWKHEPPHPAATDAIDEDSTCIDSPIATTQGRDLDYWASCSACPWETYWTFAEADSHDFHVGLSFDECRAACERDERCDAHLMEAGVCNLYYGIRGPFEQSCNATKVRQAARYGELRRCVAASEEEFVRHAPCL